MITRLYLLGCLLVASSAVLASDTTAPDPANRHDPSVPQILNMCRDELDRLYESATVAELPCGKLRGTAILSPGSNLTPTLAKTNRLVWQGKIVRPEDSTSVNRFFGVPVVRARVYQGESWMDGKPTVVLDYRQSSLVYRDVRDEVRQIGPGLYLGAMVKEDRCGPRFRMYFLLESPCACP